MEATVTFLVDFGVLMNISSITKVKILVLIKWSYGIYDIYST